MFIKTFAIGDVVTTDEGRQAVVKGMDADIRDRVNKSWVNEKYLIEYKDGSRAWKKAHVLKEVLIPDREPITNIDSINGLLQDCLLISTGVPLEMRIQTIKEMQKGIEGEDVEYV